MVPDYVFDLNGYKTLTQIFTPLQAYQQVVLFFRLAEICYNRGCYDVRLDQVMRFNVEVKLLADLGLAVPTPHGFRAPHIPASFKDRPKVPFAQTLTIKAPSLPAYSNVKQLVRKTSYFNEARRMNQRCRSSSTLKVIGKPTV